MSTDPKVWIILSRLLGLVLSFRIKQMVSMKKKLFFMDDSEDLVEIIGEDLKEFFEVNAFSKFSDAEKFLSALDTQVDVAVCDYIMPRIDGIKVLERIQDRFPNSVRILLTGYADNDSLKDKKSVYHAIMEKSRYQGPSELVALINSYLERR